MKVENFQDLFEDQIRDLYSAEKQIIDVLPDMIDASDDSELRQALKGHLDVTLRQKARLDEIGQMLDFDPDGHTCQGMKGILKEGSKLVDDETKDSMVRDAAIVASAQRVEHYEMAGYGTARTLARMLGNDEVVTRLQQTLDEEKDADARLTQVAEGHVNRRAMTA